MPRPAAVREWGHMTTVTAGWWVRGRWRVALAVAWTLFALYPDPTVLGRSIRNAWSPVIDPDAVREWAKTLPRNPRAIEDAVLTRIAYAVPWETDGVPWTFPTPAEVMARGSGDCQGRAVVLASTFAALGMPYRLEASFDHIWVDYPGRKGTGIERPERAFVRRARPNAVGRPASTFRRSTGRSRGALSVTTSGTPRQRGASPCSALDGSSSGRCHVSVRGAPLSGPWCARPSRSRASKPTRRNGARAFRARGQPLIMLSQV